MLRMMPLVQLPKLYHWIVLFLTALPCTLATYRYYSLYLAYGSGDTIISTWHAHGGTLSPEHKWVCECMDGEVMVGITDWVDDFERLQFVWCRFMFPHKPPSQGVYPYYPTCHFRNFFSDFFCFMPGQNETKTINTFVVALWDNEPQYYLFRPGTGVSGDQLQPYKCCKTPDGYYIDYISCYYQPSHDQYFEYYDNPYQFLMACVTGYVITGISKKQNPYEHEWHLEWIQCCRVGYGPPSAQTPPLITSLSGRPAYSGSIQPPVVPAGYRSQYRSLDDGDTTFDHVKMRDLNYGMNVSKGSHWDFRYKNQPIPTQLLKKGPSERVLGGVSLGGRSIGR